MTQLAEVRGECERQGLALKVEGLKLAPLRAEAEERRRSNKQMREQLGKSERERQRQRDEFAQELGAMGTPLCAKNKAAPVAWVVAIAALAWPRGCCCWQTQEFAGQPEWHDLWR